MLSRISSKANLAFSEGIDRIAFDMWTDKAFQTVAVRNVNAYRKQLLDVLHDSDVLKQIHRGVGRDLDHDVDVAVGAGLLARSGTEQGGMAHALRLQGSFVLSQ